MAGVVVEVATVPDTPLAVVTETLVTVPPPPPPPLSAAQVPALQVQIAPEEIMTSIGGWAGQAPEGAVAT